MASLSSFWKIYIQICKNLLCLEFLITLDIDDNIHDTIALLVVIFFFFLIYLFSQCGCLVSQYKMLNRLSINSVSSNVKSSLQKHKHYISRLNYSE